MRLGGPVFGDLNDPGSWTAALKAAGYSAAYCPVSSDTDSLTIRAYAEAAHASDIVIAEVGAWRNNPISPDDNVRKAGLEGCQKQLALADEIGALCCVNVAGARGELWDGPHPDNLSAATFDLIVESVRAIIDAVKPKRSFYTLETMPWIYPDSVDSYVRLVEAINRPQFAVHFDPVNLVSSPQRYFDNAALIHECFQKLGPHIKSVHAKDIVMANKLTVHLDEARPGLGTLDYRVLLRDMVQYSPDAPLMLEHLQKPEDYVLAGEYVHQMAAEVGVTIL